MLTHTLLCTTPALQEVHVVAELTQVAQLTSHGMQLPLLRYLPAEQVRSQLLSTRVLPSGHVKQLAARVPQVLQVESQAVQTFPSRNQPSKQLVQVLAVPAHA